MLHIISELTPSNHLDYRTSQDVAHLTFKNIANIIHHLIN